jgi:5-methylcytosine-specific restriction enzyme subunit McrC
MNRLYQDFVTVALTEACRPLALHVGAQDRSRTLDREGDITLVPDLTLSRQGRVVLVADAKYKRLAVTGLPNADVYQALAYAVGFEVPAAVLVYPSVEAPRATHSIASVSKLVVVRTLDLNLDPDALLEQVAALATELAFFAPAESSRSSLDIMSIPDPQWRAVAC